MYFNSFFVSDQIIYPIFFIVLSNRKNYIKEFDNLLIIYRILPTIAFYVIIFPSHPHLFILMPLMIFSFIQSLEEFNFMILTNLSRSFIFITFSFSFLSFLSFLFFLFFLITYYLFCPFFFIYQSSYFYLIYFIYYYHHSC